MSTAKAYTADDYLEILRTERLLIDEDFPGLGLHRPMYDWQLEFYSAGKSHQERMLMAANRVGKTDSGTFEDALHLTGEYPPWWTGRRFDKPILLWTGSPTNETSRDILQAALLGGLGEELGTGWIPKSRIVGKPTIRQAGIGGVVDTVKIRHASGGISTWIAKSYDQGWRKWQGTAPDVVHLDEEPEDYRIFSEAQTRVLSSKGLLMVTFTPLLGETELVQHFMSDKPGVYVKGATWDDAPHLDEKDKKELAARYRAHEREARTKGIPMLGEGRVWSVSEEEITCAPFAIPNHFARICGIDFGIDHPAAAAWVAWNRDTDTIYLYDCYKKADETAAYHASAIKKRGTWIPVAWPHDGMNREKTGGRPLIQNYKDEGVFCLPQSARYDPKTGGAQPVEPIVYDLLDRMKTGRFKVFASCTPFFEEFRSYHRKDGKIVAVRDDVTKALFYAVMDKRYARPNLLQTVRHQTQAAFA